MKLTYGKLKNMINEAVSKELMLSETEINFDSISKLTIIDNETHSGDIDEDEARTKEEINRQFILKHKNWEINNYPRFFEIIDKTPSELKGFLTRHDYEELKRPDWLTYTLKNHYVAFALHLIAPGKVDVCNLVNNDNNLNGIGNILFQFIKQEGGTQVDNYRGADGGPGKLGTLYRRNGFRRQTWRDKFNPEYLDSDEEWRLNTDKWGTPDVEGLESEKHRMRYNNPFRRKYKEKFDTKMAQKFNEQQLKGYIFESVLNQINELLGGADWETLPKGRPVSIIIDSIKSKLRLINPKNLPEDSPLRQRDFMIFVKNINNMKDILDRILNMTIQEINNSDIKAAPHEKEWQISEDNSDIFSLFIIEYLGDEESPILPRERDAILKEAEAKINERLAKSHSTVTMETAAQEVIKVTLKLPFDIALYNKEINENI